MSPLVPSFTELPRVSVREKCMKKCISQTRHCRKEGTRISASTIVLRASMRCDLTVWGADAVGAHLQGVRMPSLLPGITLNTSPTDYNPLKQMRLQRFDGQRWVLFTEIIQD
jgi:branched-chain amino acid transport system substrate-binding protein